MWMPKSTKRPAFQQPACVLLRGYGNTLPRQPADSSLFPFLSRNLSRVPEAGETGLGLPGACFERRRACSKNEMCA